MQKLVAGIDYGSDSVRAVIVEAQSGRTISEGVFAYPRWKQKKYCNPAVSQYRQHPLDYLEGLEAAMKEALQKAGADAGKRLVGIGIDTTGSTPCPVDINGTPLALLNEFRDNPNAMFHLWKDHTAVEEAKEINRTLSRGAVDYTRYQGIYSSEWFWAKILHTTRKDPAVRSAAYTWVEHCDWIVGVLTGITDPERMYRCSCAAGHKALWHSRFGGLPAREVLASMDEYLGLVYDRYKTSPQPAGTCVGEISGEWAGRLGVNPGAVIGGCSFDAHAGGVGAGVGLKTMVKVVGTSTVDMLVEHPEILEGKDLRAFCGQAEDSIVPGYVGLEMSQPAFGDAYAWLKELLLWPLKEMKIPKELLSSQTKVRLLEQLEAEILPSLEMAASEFLEEDITALDWFNGRRYPYLNESAKAAFSGLTLGTGVPSLYCALVKATVFGSKRIYESLAAQGLSVERMICVGGIAKKSKLVMQMMSDALNLPVMVCRKEQICARGAAVYGAAAAGFYSSVPEAQKVFCEAYAPNYFPDPDRNKMYETMYQKYLTLGKLTEEQL